MQLKHSEGHFHINSHFRIQPDVQRGSQMFEDSWYCEHSHTTTTIFCKAKPGARLFTVYCTILFSMGMTVFIATSMNDDDYIVLHFYTCISSETDSCLSYSLLDFRVGILSSTVLNAFFKCF